MRQAPSFRRQVPRNQHHQHDRSRQYSYSTPNQSPSAQNAFKSPPRPSMAAWVSSSGMTDRQPSHPLPHSNALWHRASGPPPRKLGDTNFRYDELDVDSEEIRLVRILPGNSDASILCEILRTSLNDPRNYIAISYAWGNAEDTRVISLEGHEFPVTISLWQALQRLRSTSFAVIVWADATCINQRNIQERNAQVQSMTKVYSVAYEVAIWLGPETDDSALAMELLVEFHACLQGTLDMSRFKDLIKASEWKPHLLALTELFEREYWDRLWVVQEVINAKEIHVYCGAVSLPWATFLDSSIMLRQVEADLSISLSGKYATTARGYSCSIILCHSGPLSLCIGDSHGHSLLKSLLYCRPKLCSDPRDKVYGLLGIISAPERSRFLVDYDISIREVYINVAYYMLVTTRRLDVICAAIHFPTMQSTCEAKLPSWVPDWSHKTIMLPVGIQLSGFSAAKKTDAQFSFLSRRMRIEIAGVRIGAIQEYGTFISAPISTMSIFMAVFQWRLMLMRLVGQDLAAHEAFCQTLYFGQVDVPYTPREWMELTYSMLASYLRESLPDLQLDAHLQACLDKGNPISILNRDIWVDSITRTCLIGRQFMMTDSQLLCIGSGASQFDDIVCVPLGCSTPIILRKMKDAYQFIGDVYVHGYMHGRAIEELDSGVRNLEKFILA